MTTKAIPTLSAQHTARVVLSRAALAGARPASSAAAVAAMVHRLGYVQIDTISAVERAHDTILRTRLRGYKPAHLRAAAERDRAIFEHWTHDASFVPAEWIPYWHHRFQRSAKRMLANKWWQQRAGGKGPALMKEVMARVRKHGPTRSRDFTAQDPARRATGEEEGWWAWSPHKAALEALWRSGKLAVAHRDGFQKAYDLFPRVHPQIRHPRASVAQHRGWACREALARLGVATAKEIAGFFDDLYVSEVLEWTRSKEGRALAIPVMRMCNDGTSERAFATTDALERAPEPPLGVRLLSPFDPIVRNRVRLERLWGFRYRFGAFVPRSQRVDGYYTLPVLDSDRFIGRCALRMDRSASVLTVEQWRAESARKSTRASWRVPARVKDAVQQYAAELGAQHVKW